MSHRPRGRSLLLALLLAVASLVPVAGAAAADGVPLRSSVRSQADPTPPVLLRGSGWGHSVGMSQYGAYAQAQAGRSYGQILQTYYPGTTSGELNDGSRQVTVRLLEARDDRDTAQVTAKRAAIDWRVCEEGDGCVRVQQDRDETWKIAAVGGSNGPQTELRDADGTVVGDGDQWIEIRLTDRPDEFDPAGDADLHIDGVARGTGTYAYGWVRFTDGDGHLEIANLLHLEGYLRGIAEVPSGWGGSSGGQEALRAQAVVARTYALLNNRTVCSTSRCQVFAGVTKERETTDGGFNVGRNWVDAVTDTRDRVLRDAAGDFAQTFYSSSHGGRTEASADSWAYGTAVPYLISVDDPWSLQSPNPMRRWMASTSNAVFRSTMAPEVGRVERIEILSRTAGGSPSEIRVTGSQGSRLVGTDAGGCSGHAGNQLRCRLSVTTRNVEGTLFTGSGNRPASSQIRSIGFAPFLDDDGNTHEYAIVFANAAGIAQGISATEYAPRRSVTRGQMATFLYRTFDIPRETDTDFPDAQDGPHAESIASISAAGIADGLNDGTFGTGDPVTRDQMATFLVRAMDLEPRDPEFRDVGDGVHSRNVGALAESGITQGCGDGRFCPRNPVTRDQMATFLYRAVRSLR